VRLIQIAEELIESKKTTKQLQEKLNTAARAQTPTELETAMVHIEIAVSIADFNNLKRPSKFAGTSKKPSRLSGRSPQALRTAQADALYGTIHLMYEEISKLPDNIDQKLAELDPTTRQNYMRNRLCLLEYANRIPIRQNPTQGELEIINQDILMFNSLEILSRLSHTVLHDAITELNYGGIPTNQFINKAKENLAKKSYDYDKETEKAMAIERDHCLNQIKLIEINAKLNAILTIVPEDLQQRISTATKLEPEQLATKMPELERDVLQALAKANPYQSIDDTIDNYKKRSKWSKEFTKKRDQQASTTQSKLTALKSQYEKLCKQRRTRTIIDRLEAIQQATASLQITAASNPKSEDMRAIDEKLDEVCRNL